MKQTSKAATRDQECCYIILQGVVQQEDKTVVTICVPNIGAP